MRKAIILIGFIIFLAIGAFFTERFLVDKPNTVNIKYEIISVDDLPGNLIFPDTKKAVDVIKNERGLFHFDNGTELIVLVSTGSEQRKIEEIKSITTTNKGQTIKIDLIENATNSSEPTSNSYTLLKLKGYRSSKEISCINQNSEGFGIISYYLNPPRTKP